MKACPRAPPPFILSRDGGHFGSALRSGRLLTAVHYGSYFTPGDWQADWISAGAGGQSRSFTCRRPHA